MLMIRARLCPCSPPGRAQPQITPDPGAVQLRDLLEHLVHDEGAQVVGPLVDQRALDGRNAVISVPNGLPTDRSVLLPCSKIVVAADFRPCWAGRR
jgi:hypothetical protein